MRLVVRAVVVAVATLASPFIGGCVGGACDTLAKASVDVEVVDAMGAPQKDAQVTFSVDDGPDEPAECAAAGAAAGSCDRWSAGFERSGTFTVKASSADGTKHASKVVEITADECHVLTQSVTLTLQ